MEPAREAAGDYRILTRDAARSRLAEEVAEVAWEHGYVLLLHYGCATAVAQVNDMDIHQPFERLYLKFEQAAFTEHRCSSRVTSIGRPKTCSTMSPRLGGAWTTPLAFGVIGKLGSPTASAATKTTSSHAKPAIVGSLPTWERARASADVEAKFAAGLAWENCRELISHPPDIGVLKEGQESESPLVDGEAAALSQNDLDTTAADDEDINAMGQPEVLALAAAEPADAPEIVEEAVVLSRWMETLRRLRRAAIQNRPSSAVYQVDRELNQLQRGSANKSAKAKHENLALRRAMGKTWRRRQRRCELAGRSRGGSN